MICNVNLRAGATALALMIGGLGWTYPAIAQEQVAAANADAADAATSPEPLSADEMEVLVARIALYPDELVAVITAASLYPLQIVEAARYLDKYEKDKSLKPKESWDGSVVSLLNYPEIVTMMSDDLDWTQALGDAIAYQQKDVLIAIQQLRDEAVAKGVIKTDDKVGRHHRERQRRHPVGKPGGDLRPAVPAGDALRTGLCSGADRLLSRALPDTTGIRARPSSPER